MKEFLSVVLLLSFGACIWGYTPDGIAEWKEAAENGEALSQTLFLDVYDNGNVVPADQKRCSMVEESCGAGTC